MKKGKILRLVAAAAALVAVVPCAAVPAFANSGKEYEYGITGSGAMVVNEQSELAVESEKLTFDISDFPDYPDVSGYKSTVTAEYKFVNTSENTVVTSMAFPIGVDPMCYGEVAPPQILLNGDNVPVQTRHTYGRYYYFDSAVDGIYDGLFEDDFYRPDTPVTEITVRVGVRLFDDIRLTGKVTCGDGARFMSPNHTDDEMTFYADNDYSKVSFYVFGDTDDFAVEWSTEEFVDRPFTTGKYRPCKREVAVVNTERTTLKEFALAHRQSDSVVSETDWYNAVVSRFGENKGANHVYTNMEDDEFTAWYTYDVRVSAGESIINTVIAPIYPTRHTHYSPPTYEYEYFLSPAKTWKSFGKLEVTVNTDVYMIRMSEPFKETDGGYRAEFETLPEGELYFTLCASENPKASSNANAWYIVFMIFMVFFAICTVATPVAGIVIAIVCAVKAYKKKKG